MSVKVARQVGYVLVDRGLLDTTALDHVLADAEQAGSHPMRALLGSGLVARSDLLQAVAEQVGSRFVDVARVEPEPGALGVIERALAESQEALPLRRDGAAIEVAIADPLDLAKTKLLQKITGIEVRPVMADRADLPEAIRRAYDSLGPAVPPVPTPQGVIGGIAPPAPEAPADTTEAARFEGAAPVVASNGQGIADPRSGAPGTGYHLNELLSKLVDAGGSDLHLTAGTPPQMRVNGELVVMSEYPKLMPVPLRELIYDVLTGRQKEQLEDKLELDCSHPVPGRGRFRVNVFFQRGSIGAVFRAIPEAILTTDELGLPPVVKELANLNRGLVLVTGPTGSGKSTTLAALIDLINSNRHAHIITIEDPIEFLHRHNRSIVNQREVGGDTHGFAAALRHALRQDPDVILVGELRDLETMSTALTAAETGHLVFATLHTQTAPQSVERMVDVFPSHQQTQVRVQLAATLQGVISQQLLRTADGAGRVAAIEVMVATPAIRNLVREGKVHQIISAMQSGAKHGMQTLDQSLAALVRSGRVEVGQALERAVDPADFMTLVGGR